MRGYISKLHTATSSRNIAGDAKIELSHANWRICNFHTLINLFEIPKAEISMSRRDWPLISFIAENKSIATSIRFTRKYEGESKKYSKFTFCSSCHSRVHRTRRHSGQFLNRNASLWAIRRTLQRGDCPPGDLVRGATHEFARNNEV